MKGESGENLSIPVPNGTIIHALETGELIGEISPESVEIIIAKGGKEDWVTLVLNPLLINLPEK